MTCALLGAPIIAVKVVAVAFSGGPATADAAGPPPAVAVQSDSTTPVVPDTEAVVAARTRADALRGRSEFSTPFYHEPTDPDEPTEEPGTEPGTPYFEIGGFIAGSRTLVMINGRPQQVGDTVNDVWRLERIDVEARSITVVHCDTDREFVLTPDRYRPILTDD